MAKLVTAPPARQAQFRFLARAAVLAVVLLGAAGCATGASPTAVKVWDGRGIVTMRAEHAKFYGCPTGALLCDGSGRLSQRSCRCAATP